MPYSSDWLELIENCIILTFYKLYLLILILKCSDASLSDEGAALGCTEKAKKRKAFILILPFLGFELNSTWVSVVEKSLYFKSRESKHTGLNRLIEHYLENQLLNKHLIFLTELILSMAICINKMYVLNVYVYLQ